MGEGVYGGYPSQEGRMVMQSEVCLNTLTQRHQHHLLKCGPQLIIIHLHRAKAIRYCMVADYMITCLPSSNSSNVV